jgi:hypothetical protein
MTDESATDAPRAHASTNRRTRIATRALLALASVFAAANLSFFFPRMVDDAFITLRYAENLVAGHGLVYNRGEWVEGYSSLSWVLLQAAGIALGLDGITATKVAAAIATVALLVGVFHMAREVFEVDEPWSAAATALVAANSYVMSWCWYGLETPLYLALLVWFAVMVRRVSDVSASGTRGLALGAVGITLALTRPEAPLLLFVVGLGAVRVPSTWAEGVSTARRLSWPALVVLVGYGAWLLARHALYGHWVPHTYFAKRGDGLVLSHLAPLVSDGAQVVEQLFWATAVLTSVASVVITRRLLVPLVLAANFYFVASVELDWMPNLRHLLPSWVFASTALVGLTHRRFRGRAAFGFTSAFAVALAAWLLAIDSRFSPYEFPTHGGGQVWVRPKTLESWSSALALLGRGDPKGFEEADPDRLGLIDLSFLAVEASEASEEESWFIGRDVGMVGYFSPIGVYETVGLFTPHAVEVTGGDERAEVPDGAIAEAFQREIVSGEIYGEWAKALGREPAILARYVVLLGSRTYPVRFAQRERPRPSAEELAARYARMAAKLPPYFHFAELYGSPAGPAIALRARVAEERARARERASRRP